MKLLCPDSSRPCFAIAPNSPRRVLAKILVLAAGFACPDLLQCAVLAPIAALRKISDFHLAIGARLASDTFLGEVNSSKQRAAMLQKRLVHVVDDDPALRQALETLIHAAGFESALYATPSAFLSIAASTSGCLLLDLKMPEMTGLEVQQRLLEMGVRLPVIVMTALSDVPTAVKAMKAGAVDFIEKPFDDKRLVAAIESAFGSATAQDWEEEGMEAAKRIAALSPRERAVLDALMVGRTNKQIAYDLDISVRTVEAHRARMLERLETHGLAEAVRLAVLANLFRAGFKAGPGWR